MRGHFRLASGFSGGGSEPTESVPGTGRWTSEGADCARSDCAASGQQRTQSFSVMLVGGDIGSKISRLGFGRSIAPIANTRLANRGAKWWLTLLDSILFRHLAYQLRVSLNYSNPRLPITPGRRPRQVVGDIDGSIFE